MSPNGFELGFIQDNGDGNQIVEIVDSFGIPVWSDDGKSLYGLTNGKSIYFGYPAYWEPESGLFKVCSKDMPFYTQIQGSGNVENPYEVIIQHVWEIIMMDLSKCDVVKRFVDYNSDPAKYSISGFSFSESTQQLIYSLILNPEKDRRYQIIRLDMISGMEEILAEGINPALSQEGNMIAYIGLDGLYVIMSNGQENRRLVDHSFFPPWRPGSSWINAPYPRWSPDGKWIVYHRCKTDELCMGESAQIYKIASNGGPEILIHSGGVYPSWGDR
jgi:hypothetical protein